MAGRGAMECEADMRRPTGMVVERCAGWMTPLDDTLLHCLAFFFSNINRFTIWVGLDIGLVARDGG
jgi:hypothetical protein